MTSSGRNEIFTVEKSLPGERLDKFLSARYPAVSRGAIQRLIDQGHIQINGRAVKPTHQPRAGEEISVCWPEARPAQAQAEDIPLDILYEDQDLLVLNKAPGIVMHPAAGHEEHTLVNALLHHCQGRLSPTAHLERHHSPIPRHLTPGHLMARVAFQSRIMHHLHLRVCGQECGHCGGVLTMTPHPVGEATDPPQDQPAIEWRRHRTADNLLSELHARTGFLPVMSSRRMTLLRTPATSLV